MDIKFNPKEYWNERLKSQYNLIGVGDISLSLNYNKWSYKVTRARLSSIFNKYVPTAKQDILDIGSGTGFVIDIWKSFGKKITGIDISSAAVEQLSIKYPSYQFFEIDAGNESLPLATNSMDAVSAASVLYHVVDDEALDRLFQNVHRVLKPNGYFIFSDNFIHKSKYKIEHQNCRTLEDYTYTVKKNGFEIVSREANYVLFNDPVDAKGKFFPRVWHLLTSMSKKYKMFDKIIWPLLYPVELFLTSLIKESPAQEIMVCKAIK